MTNHTQHDFKAGQMMTVWNSKVRKHEEKPNPYFCQICGRKAAHVLHGAD